jgi:hypothetical protein
MEILVRWTCPRCQGTRVNDCALCERTGYLDTWMPSRLDEQARIRGEIIARRGQPSLSLTK